MDEPTALQEYRSARSERAFALLVAAQIDLAYSVALRRVRDVHLAEDVTQAVFILLAKKAPMLPPSTNLSGWIFRTTQYVAKNMLRATARRRRHEEAFVRSVAVEGISTAAPDADISAAIDLALTRLGKRDQEAVILKYYRGKSWQEVGAVLGMSEEAARKRIHRALARLRGWLPAEYAAVAPAALVPSLAIRSAPSHLKTMVLQNAAVHAPAIGMVKGTLLTLFHAKIAGAAALLTLIVIPASLVVMHLLAAADAAPAAPPPNEKLPFTISKETTAITMPLREDGTVDYVAALNERFGRGVTPDNNGFVDWIQVVGTDNAGFRDDFSMWKATNGASFFPAARLRSQFLKVAGTERTPDGVKVWQPFMQYLAMKQGQNFKAGPMAQQQLAELERAGGELWSQREHDNVAGYLDRQDGFLNAIEAAAAKPKWWLPAISNDDRTLMCAWWPEIVSFAPTGGGLQCEPVVALCARATFRAKNGDFDGFKRDVMAVKELARHVASGPTLFERQCGGWIDNLATHSIGAAAGAGVLTAAQCADLIQSLDALEKMPDMAETIDLTERWLNLDLAAVIATGKFNALPEITRPDGDKRFASVDRESVDWDSVLKQINSAFDEGASAMREPRLRQMMQKTQVLARNSEHAEQNNGVSLAKMAGETQAAYSQRVGRAIMTIWPMQLAYRIVEEEARTAAMENAMLKSLLEIAQNRADSGKWPQAPGKLVLDIYSLDEAEPVQFEVKENGAMLYSVGPNGIDDNGRTDHRNHWDDIAVGAN